MSGYVVCEGTQVNHDGTVYGAGDKLDVDPVVAGQWVRDGLVVEAKPPRRTTR